MGSGRAIIAKEMTRQSLEIARAMAQVCMSSNYKNYGYSVLAHPEYIWSNRYFSSRNFSALYSRAARVSFPCTVLATAQRFRPCAVLGPVDLPPWFAQQRLPVRAAFLHCIWERFDSAWHRGALIRPPINETRDSKEFRCCMIAS